MRYVCRECGQVWETNVEEPECIMCGSQESLSQVLETMPSFEQVERDALIQENISLRQTLSDGLSSGLTKEELTIKTVEPFERLELKVREELSKKKGFHQLSEKSQDEWVRWTSIQTALGNTKNYDPNRTREFDNVAKERILEELEDYRFSIRNGHCPVIQEKNEYLTHPAVRSKQGTCHELTFPDAGTIFKHLQDMTEAYPDSRHAEIYERIKYLEGLERGVPYLSKCKFCGAVVTTDMKSHLKTCVEYMKQRKEGEALELLSSQAGKENKNTKTLFKVFRDKFELRGNQIRYREESG